MEMTALARESRALVLGQLARRPASRPEDYAKLLYQAEFGAGHLLADTEKAMAFLRREWAETPPAAGAPYEAMGRVGRVNLAQAKALGAGVETVGRLFFRAARPRGTAESYEARLEALSALGREGVFPFSEKELAEYLAAYAAAGRPAVSHSPAYRAAYAPAYRLAEGDGGDAFPLLCAIDRQLAALGRAVVAVDGMAASGKSTLAALLADLYGCPVVHMDDFFLRPEQRTPARLAEAGGNFDRERFLCEVTAPLRAGQAFSYRVFDCGPMAFGGEAPVPAAPLTVVEGSYSLHPALRGAYTLGVFLTVDGEEQSRRILARNGPQMHRKFMDAWVPMENRYFAATAAESAADLVFVNGKARQLPAGRPGGR